MAQQIGIRLNLTGAQQVTGGLDTVTRSLGTLDARTLKVGDALKGLGTGLVAALSVGTITQWVRSAIDATDQAGKLAQQLGIATDKVAGLQIAFRQSGASAEQLVPTMAKLSAAIVNGNRALDAMGVATRNTDGTLRDTRQVLGEVADRFASYRDGAAKTALAVQLFGEEGAKLLPLLSGGSRALQDADDKARAFGLTLSNEAAAAAARFNDSLDDLRLQAQGFGTSIAADVLPVLAIFATELNKVLLEARNAKTGVDGLSKDNALREWAEGAAIAVATVAEGLVGVGKLAIGIGGAFRAVAADLTFLGEVARNTLGAPLSGGIFNSENRENIRRALEERNRIVGEFNAQLDRLWNYDGSALSRRLREQFAAGRAGGGAAAAATAGGTLSAPGVAGAGASATTAQTSAVDRQINALRVEQRLLTERLILGRELTQTERERQTIYAQIETGQLKITGPELAALERQLLATRQLRDLNAQQDREARERAAQNEQDDKARAQRNEEWTRKMDAEGARLLKVIQDQLDLEARRDLARIAAYEADEDAINAALKNADDLVASIQAETAALGMTNEEREIAIALRDLENKGIEKGTYAYEEYAKRIRQAIVDRNAARESITQAEQLGREWERITDQVGQSLADALLNGGKSAGEGIKRYFSTLILQPIIRAIVDPVARSIVGALGLAGGAGTAAAGTAAGAGASSAAGAMSLLGSASSIFGGGAAATMGGNLIGAMGSAGAMMSGGATMQGLAMGAGAAAPIVAGIVLGRALYKSISGGYSVGGGSIMGNLLGFATGGLVNRAFGRKLVDQGIQGTFGGTDGFTGTGYSVEKGGWFRSDRVRASALDADVSNLLGGGFTKLRATTSQMARDLGLAATQVDAYSKDIKVNLMGLSAEQAAEKLNAELATVADELARVAAGSDATAQSLAALHQAVMSERAQLETRLLQLQGDTAELRRRERDALHESNRALYDRIIALEGERAALDALLSDTASLIQQQIGASQAAANAARQAADAYRTAGMTLIDTARALRGEASPGASAAAAYRSALGAAQGGDVSAMQSLPGLAQAYAESLRGSARSRAQYLAGTRGIAAELESVAGTAGGLGTTASIEAALLDVNTAVLRNLAEDVQNGALTVELLREHQTLLDRIASRLGDTGPLAERIDANVGATGNVIDAQLVAGDVLASSDSTLSRVLAKLSEPDANAAMLSQHVQSGNALLASRLDLVVQAISAQAAAQQAEIKRQQDLLKTQADLESAAAYLQTLQQNLASTQQTLASTSTTVQTRIGTEPWYKGKGGIYRTDPNPAYATALDSVSAAQEALSSFAPQLDLLREQIRNLGGVPAFAAGGLHSGGLRLVGERGPELEVTGPARYWSAADTTAMLGNSTRREEVLAAEIRALRAEVAGLRAETRATAENTGKTRRLWERVTRDGESMQVTDVTPTP